MAAFNSPGSRNSNAKKRRRNEIWDKFHKEEDSFGEIKWKCNQRQERLSNHQTSVSRHWELKHNDKQQLAKKVGPTFSEDPSDTNTKKLTCAKGIF